MASNPVDSQAPIRVSVLYLIEASSVSGPVQSSQAGNFSNSCDELTVYFTLSHLVEPRLSVASVLI